MRTVLVATVCLLLPAGALSEEPAPPPQAKPLGIELSLRVGPSIPGGEDVLATDPFFPLWLGLGYRIGGVWYVGISGVYAPASTLCPICGARYNVQFLVEATVHPLAYGRIDPWIGLGVGGEWFNSGNGPMVSSWVPVMFEVGVEFALARTFRVGPFYAFQFVVTGGSTATWNVFGLQLSGLP
jgi:hypothetical protein